MHDLKIALERITLREEEEAKEVLEYRLRSMGVSMILERIELPGLELDLYGVVYDLCLIGEATTKLDVRLVEELEDKAERLAEMYPERLRSKLIKTIYTIVATSEALKKAEEKGIWVLNWKGDLSKAPPLAVPPLNPPESVPCKNT
ncbi:MAG: hypothetical protein ACUVTM_08735 [Candidatus Bathyarchaeia archaeon]